MTEHYFEAMLRAYDRTLQVVLQHRGLTMAASAVVLILTAVLFVIVPKGFIPDQDTDQLSVTTEAAQGTSYDKLVEYQDRVADIIRDDPNVEALVSTIGGSAANTLGGPNLGQIVVHLKPRGERELLANAIIEKLRPQLASVVGMQVFVQNPPTIRIGGQVSKSLYQFSMQSPDREALYAASRTLLKSLGELEGLSDLTSDLQVTSPQVNVEIDRDKAAALGVTANAIENAFYDAYGPRWVSTIYAPVNEYKVLLELAPQFQADPASLSLLYFKATPPQNSGAAATALAANGTGAVAAGRPRQRRRHRRPARYAGESHAGDRPADGEPLRPAAGGDDLVRPRAGCIARRRAEPRARAWPSRRCRKASTASSRAPPRRSRARCRISPCCSSSPSWWSTSCSASSTKATSTR